MIEISDYIVITSETFILAQNKNKTLKFDMPENIKKDDDFLLSYQAVPQKEAKVLANEVSFNRELDSIGRYTADYYGENIISCIQQLFPSSKLRPGKTNEIEFRCEKGYGECEFSNVILWYKKII